MSVFDDIFQNKQSTPSVSNALQDVWGKVKDTLGPGAKQPTFTPSPTQQTRQSSNPFDDIFSPKQSYVQKTPVTNPVAKNPFDDIFARTKPAVSDAINNVLKSTGYSGQEESTWGKFKDFFSHLVKPDTAFPGQKSPSLNPESFISKVNNAVEDKNTPRTDQFGLPKSELSQGSKDPILSNSLERHLYALTGMPKLSKNVITESLGGGFDASVKKIEDGISMLDSSKPNPVVAKIPNATVNYLLAGGTDGVSSSPTKQERDQILEKYGTPVDAFGKKINNFTAADRAIGGVHIVNGILGLVFSPITAAFEGAKTIPGVSIAAKTLGMGFNAVGQVGSGAVGALVDNLPISEESKAKWKGPLQELAATAAQIAAGGTLSKYHTELIKKADEIRVGLTKDIATENIIPKTLTYGSDKVRSFINDKSNPVEARAFLQRAMDASGGKAQIKVDTHELTTISDKPWFGAIKNFFNLNPEHTEIYTPDSVKLTFDPNAKEETATQENTAPKGLPGYQDVPGQAPAMGLSIRAVRRVGGEYPEIKPEDINAVAERVRRMPRETKPEVSSVSDNEKKLTEEAKKYKSAEEFISKMRGSATQYTDYTPELRKGGISKEDFRITEKGVDPELEVTIYRGVPDTKTGIVDGDFVTTDRLSAESYAGKNNVVSKKVKAKDLIHDDPGNFDPKDPFSVGSEFIYSDSKNKLTKYTDDQLKDIYNKAVGKDEPSFNAKDGRTTLPDRPVQLERVAEYQKRLRLKGADPVIVQAIVTPQNGRAYGVSYGGKLIFEDVVQHLTEDHEVFHQVFTNAEKMALFKKFDKTELLDEARDLYGDMSDADLEEQMAIDFQQYVHERETSKPNTFFGKIKDFFERLYASLKRIFKTEKDIKEFYRTVYEEKAGEDTVIKAETSPLFNRKLKDGVADFRVMDVVHDFLKEVPEGKVFNDKGDLTLKTLTKLTGRATVSKQFIEDLTNSGDIKQVERDLIRTMLADETATVDVQAFADKVKAELLPLSVEKLNKDGFSPRYESISLPEETRGNVANYTEHIYESPIKTSAGSIHFSDGYAPNYFGHTRIEDMADTSLLDEMGDPVDVEDMTASQRKLLEKNGGSGNTRRVIEVQSDLYQKGGLERMGKYPEKDHIPLTDDERNKIYSEGGSIAERNAKTKALQDAKRNEFNKLYQYNNPTAHFRMVREEIKRAAQDGKTKLQFPTGETAMKVEGLGPRNNWEIATTDRNGNPFNAIAEIGDLKVGQQISQQRGDDWIITDVLGDGKFKAVPADMYDDFIDGEEQAAGIDETFDISGKVDTNNPIYRFYEKDLGRYLMNNYDAKPVTDDKGVTWYEVPVDKGYADLPVPAFNKKPEDMSPQEIMAEAEKKSKEPKAQDYINGLKELIQKSRSHDGFMTKLTTDPAYADNLPKLDSLVRDAGYQNFTDMYAKEKSIQTKEKVEVPKSTMKPIAQVMKEKPVQKVTVPTSKVTIPEGTKERKAQFDYLVNNLQDRVNTHPGKLLQKFASKTEGQLLDFGSPDTAKTETERKAIIARNKKITTAAELAFDGTQYKGQHESIDAIRQSIEEYQAIKQDLIDLKEAQGAFNKALKGYILDEKDKLALEKIAKRAAVTEFPMSLHDVTPPTVRGGIQSPKLSFDKWHDIAAIRQSRDTFERNIEKIAPREDAEKIKNFIVDPVLKNEFDRTEYSNKLKLGIRDKMKELGISRNTKNDELIQLFGEKMIDLAQLQEAAPKEWKNIEHAAAYARTVYDGMIDKWNEVRVKYGYPPIPKRADYFRHFDEIGFWTKNFGFLRSQDQLPTELAGKTEFFKPGKPFTTAELRRTGNSTKYSAIGGLDNYIDAVSKQIYHIDSLQRGRALERYLEEASKYAANTPEKLKLSNFATNLREYVNNGLAGKVASIDRSLESYLGRPTIRAVESISNLIGKNIIAGNISVALTHLVTTPINLATTDKVSFMKGLVDSLTVPFRDGTLSKIDGQTSTFLTRRFPVETIIPTNMDNVQNVLSYLFKVTDQFKSRLAVAGKYYEGIKNGLSPEDAMAKADTYARRLVGDYSIGQRPNILNAKTTRIFAQFQLGLNDSISVLMHDIPEEARTMEEQPDGSFKEKVNKGQVIWKLIQWAVFAYIFNQEYKKLRGSGKGLDPIQFVLDLLGSTDETQGQNFGARLGTGVKDIAGELPFTSIFTGSFPLASAFGDIKSFASDAISGKLTKKEVMKVGSEFLSPIGGGLQAKKTAQGIDAIKQGEAKSISQKIKALIFGPAAVPDTSISTALDKKITTYKNKINTYNGSMVDKVQGVFDQVKKLGFDAQESDDLVSGLTDNEYTIYKEMRNKYLAEDAKKLEATVLPIVKQAHDLGFDSEEADALVTDKFPETPEGDRAFDAYQTVKDILYGKDGIGDDAVTNTPKSDGSGPIAGKWEDQGFITHVANIAHAVGTDPVTAFKDIFAGNQSYRIVKVSDGNIFVARADENVTGAVRKSLGANKDLILDHVRSLELGGNNGTSNLWLIPKDQSVEDDQVENYLGKLVKENTLSAKKAQELEIRYKKGVDAQYIDDRMKKIFDSVGEPLTFDDIKNRRY